MDNYIQLELKNISQHFFQHNHQLKVLDDVSIKFKSSLSYGLVGASGTGKSTLIYLLTGLEYPTKGTILYNNQDINKFTKLEKEKYLRDTIGLVFQMPSLIGELSVLENVMIKGLIERLPRTIIEKRGYELLEQIGLADKAKSAPNLLSGGEQQRVALARALFNKPKILIADEPTAHLDCNNKKIIMDLLLQYQNTLGMMLIVATHDMVIAQNMTTILKLENGQLLDSQITKNNLKDSKAAHLDLNT